MSAVLVISTITLEGNRSLPVETYSLSVPSASFVPLAITALSASKYSLSIAGTGRPVPTRGQLWPPTR